MAVSPIKGPREAVTITSTTKKRLKHDYRLTVKRVASFEVVIDFIPHALLVEYVSVCTYCNR